MLHPINMVAINSDKLLQPDNNYICVVQHSIVLSSSFQPGTTGAFLVLFSVLTSKEISFEKLDFIRGREEFLIYSLQMFFVPSLFKASFPTVKTMRIKIVTALSGVLPN